MQRYNRDRSGHMQFIPHIEVRTQWNRHEQEDHIKQQMDRGGVALYVWGVCSDPLIRDGQVGVLARAVEMAKKHGLPVGVGSHSLQVPIHCEKAGVTCDFYVKALHSDDYFSAAPSELRKAFIWLDGGKGWYYNMWCLNPEETIAFMQTVAKPWIALKVLAAGAIPPAQAFPYSFKKGPISSPSACSTSRSRPTPSSPSGRFATTRSAIGHGGPDTEIRLGPAAESSGNPVQYWSALTTSPMPRVAMAR